MNKLASKLKKLYRFLLNPRFLLCFGIAWMITNGWSYVMMGFGAFLDVKWMMAVAGAYLAFLWLPISPEKIVTVTISMLLLRWLFPNDQNTLAVLRNMYNSLNDKLKKKRSKKRRPSASHDGSEQ